MCVIYYSSHTLQYLLPVFLFRCIVYRCMCDLFFVCFIMNFFVIVYMYIQSYFIWVMYSTYEVYCLMLGLIYFSMRRNELKMYALHCTLPAETERNDVSSFSHCYGCTLGIS